MEVTTILSCLFILHVSYGCFIQTIANRHDNTKNYSRDLGRDSNMSALFPEVDDIQMPAVLILESSSIHNTIADQSLRKALKLSNFRVCPIVRIPLLLFEEDEDARNVKWNTVIESSSYGYTEEALFIIEIKLTSPGNLDLGRFLVLRKLDDDGDSYEELPQFHANIVIAHVRRPTATQTYEVVRWSMFCYFCPIEDKILPWTAKGVPDLYAIADITSKINKLGYGSPAQIFSTTDGEAYDALRPDCWREEFGISVDGCFESHIILKILSLKLNVTLTPVPENEIEEKPSHPGLHICILCNYSNYEDSMKYYNPKLHVNVQKTMGFVYCYYRPDFEKPEWSTYARPFDKWIWTCILATALTYAAHFRNVGHGIDIFVTLLAQTMQNKVKGWAVPGLVFLSVLTNAYLGVVTTNLIQPLAVKQFSTLEESKMMSNFRFIIPGEKFLQLAIDTFIKELPKYSKRADLKTFFRVVDDFPAHQFFTRPLEVVKSLADNEGIFIISDNLITIKPYLSRDMVTYKFMNISCTYILEDKMENFKMIWTIRQYLSVHAMHYLQLLAESGIQKFFQTSKETVAWYLSLKQEQYRSDKKKDEVVKNNDKKVISRSRLFGFWEPNPMPLFESNLRNVFILHLSMSLMALVCYLLEIRVRLMTILKSLV